MAKPQQLQPVIMEHQHEGKDDVSYDDGGSVSGGCFRLFCCFDNHNHDGEAAGFLHHQSAGGGGGDLIDQNTWLMKRAKSLKEFSEVVAGPKWKNFIRRFSKRPKTTRSSANTPFQYDPQSYALNFNDHEDDDLLPRSFSTRYAPPSRSTQL